VTVQPQPETLCEVCGTPVTTADSRCPSCGLSRPASRGSEVLGRNGFWMLALLLVGVYAVVLVVVAAAR
jgi:predicted amidophosphoribosyltransferase